MDDTTRTIDADDAQRLLTLADSAAYDARPYTRARIKRVAKAYAAQSARIAELEGALRDLAGAVKSLRDDLPLKDTAESHRRLLDMTTAARALLGGGK